MIAVEELTKALDRLDDLADKARHETDNKHYQARIDKIAMAVRELYWWLEAPVTVRYRWDFQRQLRVIEKAIDYFRGQYFCSGGRRYIRRAESVYAHLVYWERVAL